MGNNFKRFLAFVLAFAMVFAYVPANAFAAETDETASTTVEVATLTDLQAALAAEGTEPIVITAQIVIPEGEPVELDLNGKTVNSVFNGDSKTNHIYALSNEGTLTITDTSAKKNGSINSRGIYNYGSLTLEAGAVNSIDGNGGYAVNNESGSTFMMNGGTVAATYEDDHQSSSGGYDATPLEVPAGCTATLNGGKITNVCDFTFAIAAAGTLNVPATSTIEVIGTHGAIAVQGGTTTVDAGTFKIPTDEYSRTDNVLYVSGGELIVNGGTFIGDYDTASGGSCLCDTVGTATVNGGSFSGSSGGDVWGTDGTTIKGGTFENLIEIQHVAVGATIVNGGKTYTKTENGEMEEVVFVAKIGEQGYETLAAAVEAVADGGTITLIANETFTEDNWTHNSGSWYDGLYYVGDKSFTIDLGGFTITQNGAVNDYLLNFKNDGTKANTITIKNGTLDAGTTAFCAICTSSGSTQQITINLEDVNVINNISNGSTIKLRGDAVLNVNDGTVITGKNSYLAIECVASTVNIYDGAEIYMNGNSSYNGCLVGACGGGTVNVYGGYGKGVKGGFIAMTSGGTINVSGGEWIANTNGAVGDNSNLYVLTAQNNKKESGYVGASIINVSGGIFRGGMDAWILNDATVEKAELNISGGNFNADPENYLTEGFEVVENADGTFGVKKEWDGVTISNLAELKMFRDKVNAGDNYSGKTVVLTADIDLGNEEWTPIGYMGATFKGTFDGGDHTISNLKITKTLVNAAENNGIGFFGRTDDTAVIKNLVIENVDITGSLYVGAVVGLGYTGKSVENVTVKGNITIDAWWYAGVIGGYGYVNLVNDCHVIGNEGSYVKGNGGSYIGGIWGFRGEGNNKITNCSVKGLDIIGVDRVGGICGIGHYGNTISGCAAEDVTVTATDPEATTVGLIVGACEGTASEPTVFENNDVADVEARIANGDGTYTKVENAYGTNINGSTPVVEKAVAKVNGVEYKTLQAAIEAANAMESATVTVLNDVVLDAPLVITGVVTLDLNGYDISGVRTEKLTANDALIRITKGGKLTVTDSGENGSITYGYTGEATGWGGYSASTIENNQGTLIIEGGKIVSTTNVAQQIAYAVNSLTNGNIGDAYVTITGGEIVAAGSTAVRQFANSTTCTNSLVIEGGKITGRVQLQSSNKNDNKGVLTITGGEIIREGNTAIEVWFSGGKTSAYTGTQVSIGGDVKVSGNVVFDEAPAAYDTKVISGGTFDAPVAEEFCAEGFVPVANGNGTYGVVRGLKGSGTEADPYLIGSVEDLILFRDSVNAGETKYNAPDVWVALAADIDLAGTEAWTVGIGDGHNYSFDGCFDGKGHTIKNLNMAPKADSNGYVCGGLFGYTYGAVVIKNLTLENVTIDASDAKRTGNVNTEPHNVGALVGFANNKGGKLNVSNVTVKNVTINAPYVDGVGAIVGYSYRAMGTIEKCSVEGATITGYNFVGGITGYSYDEAVITGCTVNSATITAFKGAGGIAGLIHGNSTVTNNTVANTNVTAPTNWGYVVGEIGSSNGALVVGNSAAEPQVGGNYSTGEAVQAKIGDKYYVTLEAALTAAKAGDVIELLTPYVVEADETVTLDLKGATIIYNSTIQGEAMITNKGTLIINDSVGGGEINYNYTGAADPNYRKGNYTISNAGTLTVNGGKITIANLSGHAKYPIDNNSTTGDAVLVINGGHLYNYNTSAIRQFCNSTTYKNSVTINGGQIEGYCAIWMQNPGKNTVNVSLTITGGEIKSTAKAYVTGTSALEDVASAIYCTTEGGAWSEKSAISITGGIFNENVYLAEDAPADITIGEDATFNGRLELPMVPVAKIGEQGYATINEALAAAQAGDTITLLADMSLSESLVINKAITLDLNGKTISGTCTASQAYLFMVNNGATLTIKDSSDEQTGKITFAGDNSTGWIVDVEGALVLESGTLELTGTWSIGYAVDVRPNAWGTAYTAPTTFVMNGGKIVSSDGAVRVASSSADSYKNISASFTMNGGVIDAAWDGVFVQQSNAAWDVLNVTINGGTIKSALNPIRFYGPAATSYVNGEDCVAIKLNGGTLSYTGTETREWLVDGILRIGGGATAAEFLKDSAVTASQSFAAANVADGFKWVEAENGKYELVECNYVAEVNGKKYESLQAAINAAQAGDTITLLADMSLSESLVINKAITLDLNGKTISGTCAASQAYLFMVNNGATLTIEDSSAKQTGKITFAGDKSTGWIVDVEGALVLESGTLELTGTWVIGYAVDVRPNAWGTAYTAPTTFVMNDGKIVSSDGAVRVASSSSDTYNNISASFTMNGGEIEAAWDGVFVQQSDAAWDVLNVTINDGTIKSAFNPIRFYGPVATSYVNGEDCVAIELNGGTLTYTGTEAPEWLIEGVLRLGGGVTAAAFLKDSAVTASQSFAAANVADGFKWVAAENGKYELVECDYVAEVNGKQYESLEAAIAAANAGDTITLLAPVVIEAGEELTLDKAVTITYTSNVPGEDMITNRGILNIGGDVKITYINTDTTAGNVTVSTISCEPGSVLNVTGGTVENKTVKADGSSIYSYAIDLLTNGSLGEVTATISGGTVYSDYMAIRQFNNGTACKNSLTVTGGYIYGAKRAIQVHLNNDAAHLTIEGGKIEAGKDGYALCLFPETATHIAVKGGEFIGTVYSGTNGIISGGTYSEEPYADYIVEGYEAEQNENGTWGVQKKAEVELFEFYGSSVTMGNELDLLFYFSTDYVDNTGYAQIVRSYGDGRADETTTVQLSDCELSGRYYKIVYKGVAAKEMCDELKVTIFDGSGNQISVVRTESVRSYALRVINHESQPATAKTMMVDMLNYGAAAQVYKGYNTDDLANSTLTDDQKALGTQTMKACTNNYTKSNENYYGTSFVFGNELSLKMYVKKDAIGANGYVVVDYINHLGQHKTATITESTLNGKYYEFLVNEIVVADGRCLLTCTFYTADNTEVVTVTESLESYVSRGVNAYPWLEEVMNFSDSAYAYLHRNDNN